MKLSNVFFAITLGLISLGFSWKNAYAGSRVETMWVIENSASNAPLIRSFKKEIGTFFIELEMNKLDQTALMVSSDAQKWDGLPLSINKGSLIIVGTAADATADFKKRLDVGHSSVVSNSPLWSLFRLYQRAPSLSEIYQTKYFVPTVPTAVMLVVGQADEHARYAKGTPQASYNAADFANYFIHLNTADKKPLLVSAISADVSGSAYKTVVKATGGTYYDYKAGSDISRIIRDYAEKVVRWTEEN